MRAMDRRARECEAASVLLAALHPKLIDPQQVPPAPAFRICRASKAKCRCAVLDLAMVAPDAHIPS